MRIRLCQRSLAIGWWAVGFAVGAFVDSGPGFELNPVERALNGPLRHRQYLAFEIRAPHIDWPSSDSTESGALGGSSREIDVLYRCRLDLRTGKREILTGGETGRAGDGWRTSPGGSYPGKGASAIFDAGSQSGLNLFHAWPVPASETWVAIAVPQGAVTREKGWLALVDARASIDGTGRVRLPGTESGRLEHMLAAFADLKADDAPIHVEHPEFRWRYPCPLGDNLFLVLSDRAIWAIDSGGRAAVLYEEVELEGELAWVLPEFVIR